MRTSRISRETAHVVGIASTPTQRSTRRSLHAFANAEVAKSGTLVKQEAVNGSDSGLSESPSSPDNARRTAASSLGKRKRGNNETSTNPPIVESKTTRRSPRKQPPVGDGASARKPRRQPVTHVKGPNGIVTVEPPANWERIYNTTAAQRKRVLAPVDTMGCESLAEEHRSPRDQRLQTLVSLMLSSQTKDTVTAAAMRTLQEKLPRGFCLDSLLRVEPEELNRLIEKVGFHNNKTKFIKSVAVILQEKHGGDIPDTIEGLVSLPGVGPKMAYLCMSAAWGRDEGIGVDVHVHRITNLWGWHKTSTPEQTRAELESWLPRDKWHDINHLLVGFGQTVCLPVGRRCGECDLASQGLCPSAVVTKSAPVKRKMKKEMEIKMDIGRNEPTKAAEVMIEADDRGVKVEADLGVGGEVEMMAPLPVNIPGVDPNEDYSTSDYADPRLL